MDPLVCLRLIKDERGYRKREESNLLSLALFLVASFDYYYLYFMLIATFLFWTYSLTMDRSNGKRLTVNLISTAVLAGVVITIILWPLIKTRLLISQVKDISVWSLYRPFEDLFSQSARPLSYFLPSSEHPILGWIAKGLVGTDIYGMSFTEHALYLGWTPLVLAFVAVRRWRSNRKSSRHRVTTLPESNENFNIGFFVFWRWRPGCFPSRPGGIFLV